MRKISFVLVVSFVLINLNLGFCDNPKLTADKNSLTASSSEKIIKEEWEKANNSKKRPQYSPSSVSVDEKVLSQKPLMTSDAIHKADEKVNELQTKFPSVPDLPKEFDQIISLKGKMKVFEALKLISKALNRNLILGMGVQDSDIDASLDNIQIHRALSSILYPLGYGFKINESGDLVVLAQETRMFRINLPPVNQELDTVTTNETLSGDNSGTSNNNSSSNSNSSGNNNTQKTKVGTRVVVENKSESLSLWQDVATNLKDMLLLSEKFTLNKVAGMAIVTASPATLDRIGAYINEINKHISQQIIVDVKVVEVTLNDDHKQGIDWSYIANKGKINISTNFASQNIADGNYFSLLGGDTTAGDGFNLLLKNLSTFGKAEVLSQPRVMLLNNTVANIQVGQSRSYIERSAIEVTQNGNITSTTTNQVQGGVTLQLIGNIVGDDIYLNVTPVVSTIDKIRSISLGANGFVEAPETSTKSISSMVRVKEGTTGVIGGLITHNNSESTLGIPILDKIPFGIGKNLFSYQTRNNDKTELVIFITPKRG